MEYAFCMGRNVDLNMTPHSQTQTQELSEKHCQENGTDQIKYEPLPHDVTYTEADENPVSVSVGAVGVILVILVPALAITTDIVFYYAKFKAKKAKKSKKLFYKRKK